MDKKRIIIIIGFIIVFILSIIISQIYYNDKYSIYFETGTDEVILTQYVEKNDKVSKPMDPEKEGYVFIEWQLDGETYDFDKKIKSDTILTAKWMKEEYVTINFNTNSDYKIESIKILKGEVINELPESQNDGYVFIGWYLNDNLYNGEEIYDDITLNALYKNDTVNPTYKIGEEVKIIGIYASASFSDYAYHRKAIGWERKIINIVEGTNYPYVVGNEDGVVGFFKAESIERID